MKRIAVLFGLLSLLAPWVALASDFQQRQSTLYPYQSSIFLQEEFISGNTTSGGIGGLGWNASGGTTTNLAGESNRFGIVRRDTGVVSGTVANLSLNSGSAAAIDPATPHSITFILRLNNNDANTAVRIGSLNSTAISPPTNGIYIEKLDADTNWFCVTRSGGVQTRNDSGVAINTSFNTFSYTRNSSGVMFSINRTVVCSQSTNIPTTFLNPTSHIVNSIAAAKTIDIDYAEVILTGLTR